MRYLPSKSWITPIMIKVPKEGGARGSHIQRVSLEGAARTTKCSAYNMMRAIDFYYDLKALYHTSYISTGWNTQPDLLLQSIIQLVNILNE